MSSINDRDLMTAFYLECSRCEEVGQVVASGRREAAQEFERLGWENLGYGDNVCPNPECREKS